MMVKVREIRQQRGITVYELAKRSGLAQSFVWRLDHGTATSPGIGSLVKLAKALDCEVTDLYEEEVKAQ